MRALLATAALVLVLAAPSHARDLQSQTKSYAAAGLHKLTLELPPGEVTLRSSGDDHVRLTVGIHCDHDDDRACERRAEDLDLDSDRNGDQLGITLKDRTSWNGRHTDVRSIVEVPRGVAVSLELGAGELNVYDLGDDLEVAMGAGDATLHLRESDVGSVRVRVGVGDATLHTRTATYDGDGFISRTLHWGGGSGSARVRIVLGAGDVDLRLD